MKVTAAERRFAIRVLRNAVIHANKRKVSTIKAIRTLQHEAAWSILVTASHKVNR